MTRGRKAAYWIGGIIAGLVLLVVGGTWAYIHVFSSDPEPAFSLNTGTTTAPNPTTTSTAGATASTSGAASTATTAATSSSADDGSSNDRSTWQVADGSQAGYRVKEVLFGQSTTAVGRTSDVTGSITLDGATVPSGTFSVDMTTVQSDKSQRDGQFQDRIMETSTYPTSTFKLTKPIELGSVPAEGQQIAAKATGDLTLHGTTKTVTFDVQAKKAGSTIQVVGQIPIVFADYNIPNPSFGPASTDDNGILEFSLVFSPEA